LDWNGDIRFNECNIDLKWMLLDQGELEEGAMESTEIAKEFQRL
jgi:hypothetical protein